MDDGSAHIRKGLLGPGEASQREALASGLVMLACLVGLGLTLQARSELPMRFLPTVAGAFMLVLVAVWATLPRNHPHREFGLANQVTLLRSALAALLLGCVVAGAQATLAWEVLGIAVLAASLDALDGPLARRLGTTSAFGARFDMEADAGFVMVLSLLVWQFDKAGAWVLASGLMRYAFVLAGVLMPWLRGTLPPSLRRKAVCVVQVVALVVCLAPVVPVVWSTVMAALALIALAGSFLTDIAWLARHRHASYHAL